jgi:hypothetical protein
MLLSAGLVSGHGHDQDGEFTYSGEYGGDNRVVLTKVYTVNRIPVPASMTYDGSWNGHYLAGIWRDDSDSSNRGSFELWPRDEEALIQSLHEAEEERAQKLSDGTLPIPTSHPAGSATSPLTASNTRAEVIS